MLMNAEKSFARRVVQIMLGAIPAIVLLDITLIKMIIPVNVSMIQCKFNVNLCDLQQGTFVDASLLYYFFKHAFIIFKNSHALDYRSVWFLLK